MPHGIGRRAENSFAKSARASVAIISLAAGQIARRGALEGFAGTLARVRGVYEAVQKTWPVGPVPDVLIDAMQSGDRLSGIIPNTLKMN